MSFSPFAMNYWVSVAAVPYLVIAGYDFWLHDNDRQVPRAEAVFHAVVITAVITFLASATLGWNLVAKVALFVLLPAAAVDEIRFHGGLGAHERRIHFLGGGALAACIGVWIWTT